MSNGRRTPHPLRSPWSALKGEGAGKCTGHMGFATESMEFEGHSPHVPQEATRRLGSLASSAVEKLLEGKRFSEETGRDPSGWEDTSWRDFLGVMFRSHPITTTGTCSVNHGFTGYEVGLNL